MAIVLSLLTKLGLFAPKATEADVFDMRLTRINTRENRRDVKATIFIRNLL